MPEKLIESYIKKAQVAEEYSIAFLLLQGKGFGKKKYIYIFFL